MRNLILLLVFALSACSADPSPQPGPPQQGSPALAVETVAAGLEFPWGLAFLPDGSMLVTERNGGLRVIENGQLRPQAVANTPQDVYADDQGGLLDVAIDPDFAANRLIYLSYSAGTRKENTTKLIRARFDGNALSEVVTLFEQTPKRAGSLHFGGRILILPDRTLLLTLGDRYREMREAQTLDDHFGKIIRIGLDGGVPKDNPFVGKDGALAHIFTLGHRNPQGIARDPATGAIYAAEFGPKGGDEVNVIVAGRNYGWPVITYGVDYSGAPISNLTEKEGLEQPLVYWTPSISPSGMAFYSGSLFPMWRGDLFLANLSGQHLRRLDLEGGRVVGEEALLSDLEVRFRHVAQGPDGALYLLTDEVEGRVLRIKPKG